MKDSNYKHLCSEAKAGRDVFVRHTNSNEEGQVTDCVLQSRHVIVKTAKGEERSWDANECEEVIDLNSRPMV